MAHGVLWGTFTERTGKTHGSKTYVSETNRSGEESKGAH